MRKSRLRVAQPFLSQSPSCRPRAGAVAHHITAEEAGVVFARVTATSGRLCVHLHSQLEAPPRK